MSGDYPGKWEKSAERENERRRRDAPLLFWAGLVPKATAAERKQMIEERSAYLETRFDELHARFELKAELYRRRVAFLVTPAELLALDEKRNKYPPGPEYLVTFWMVELEKRGGRRL